VPTRVTRGSEAGVAAGEYSTAEVAELFGIGRSTVYRAIERPRIEARAGLAETSRR
jgi:transposase